MFCWLTSLQSGRDFRKGFLRNARAFRQTKRTRCCTGSNAVTENATFQSTLSATESHPEASALISTVRTASFPTALPTLLHLIEIPTQTSRTNKRSGMSACRRPAERVCRLGRSVVWTQIAKSHCLRRFSAIGDQTCWASQSRKIMSARCQAQVLNVPCLIWPWMETGGSQLVMSVNKGRAPRGCAVELNSLCVAALVGKYSPTGRT